MDYDRHIEAITSYGSKEDNVLTIYRKLIEKVYDAHNQPFCGTYNAEERNEELSHQLRLIEKNREKELSLIREERDYLLNLLKERRDCDLQTLRGSPK